MELRPSPRKGKKWEIIFKDGQRVSFGAKGYQDYTTFPISIRDERKRRYLLRHQNENWTNPRTPAALSRYILWNLPTIHQSFQDYKRRFNL